MRNMSVIAVVAALMTVLLGVSQVDAAPAAGDVLIMRYAWAPIFCYAGSNAGVPKEYCGLEPPALQRFNVHRAGRISYSADSGDVANCTDPTSGYSPDVLSPAVRNALQCTSNSYTIGNNDDYWKFLWEEAGICIAQQTGMTAKKYFWLLNNSFKRYDVDSALKAAKYDFSKVQEVNATQVLDALQNVFGYRGFYTCDTGTRTKWSTVNFCLSALPPYRMTHCPAKMLDPPPKCPTTLKIDTEHGGTVSDECIQYYPSALPTPPEY